MISRSLISQSPYQISQDAIFTRLNLMRHDGIARFMEFQNYVREKFPLRRQDMVYARSQDEVRSIVDAGGHIVFLVHGNHIKAAYLLAHAEDLHTAERILSVTTTLPDQLTDHSVYKVVLSAIIDPIFNNTNMMDEISQSISWVMELFKVNDCLFKIDWRNIVTLESALTDRTAIIAVSIDDKSRTNDFVLLRRSHEYECAEGIQIKKMDNRLSVVDIQNQFDLGYIGCGYNPRTRELYMRQSLLSLNKAKQSAA